MTCRPLAGAALLLILCACGDAAPEQQSGIAAEQQRVEVLSAEVARLAPLDVTSAECGPPAAAGRKVVVFATADLCLSCLEVGALLRDVTRRGVPVPDRIVVTPAPHSREVCEYLRREKVRWRVIGIAEDVLPVARAPHGIVYFEMEPDGRIGRREHAATPLHLAEILLPRPGAPVPAQP